MCAQLGVRVGRCVVLAGIDGVADRLEFAGLIGHSVAVHFLFLQRGHHLRFPERCSGVVFLVFPPSPEEQCEDEEADGGGGCRSSYDADLCLMRYPALRRCRARGS